MSKKVIFIILIILSTLFSINVFATEVVGTGQVCDNVNTVCSQYSMCYNGKCAVVDSAFSWGGAGDCGPPYNSCSLDGEYCVSPAETSLKQCSSNLYCDIPAGGGSACYLKLSDGIACLKDIMCKSGLCDGTCQTPGVIVTKKAIGEPCNAAIECESEKCEDTGQGLFCTSTDIGFFEKVKNFFGDFGKKKFVFLNTKQDGEICTKNEDCISNDCFGYGGEEKRCRSNNYWIGDCFPGTDGICSFGADTNRCLLGNELKYCAEGYYCKTDPAEGPGCTEKNDVNTPCTIDLECASGNCDSNVCVAPEPIYGITNSVCGTLEDYGCSEEGDSCQPKNQNKPLKVCNPDYFCQIKPKGDISVVTCMGKKLNYGEQCNQNYQCLSDVCNNLVCGGCDSNDDCLEGNCNVDTGACEIPDFAGDCGESYECAGKTNSDKCTSGTGTDKICSDGFYCKYTKKITGFGSGFGGGFSYESECVVQEPEDAACETDVECLSGNCGDDGQCATIELPECDSNDDCLEGNCNIDTGVCEISGSTGSCGYGYICSEDKTRCVFKIENPNILDIPCADTNYCTLLEPYVSEQGLNPLATCEYEKNSENGEQCSDDIGCLSGNCGDDGQCATIELPECDSGDDCGENGLCDLGTCYQSCQTNEDCGGNQVCSEEVINDNKVCADDLDNNNVADVVEEDGGGGDGGSGDSGCLICPQGAGCYNGAEIILSGSSIKCCETTCGVTVFEPVSSKNYLVDYSCNDINNDGSVERVYTICIDNGDGKCGFGDSFSISQDTLNNLGYSASKGIDGYCNSEVEPQPVPVYGLISILLSLIALVLFYKFRNR